MMRLESKGNWSIEKCGARHYSFRFEGEPSLRDVHVDDLIDLHDLLRSYFAEDKDAGPF